MIFSSTEIGTGSATTPTVVLVGRLWSASKYSRVNPVERGEVAVDVRQKDRHVDHLLERAPGVLENRLDVLDARARLSLDAFGNLLGLPMPRADPGKEEQIPEPASVRIGTEGPRRAGGHDGRVSSRRDSRRIYYPRGTPWNRRR